MAFKVKYTAGAGVQLARPLSDGQSSFRRSDDRGKAMIYEIKNLGDFVRLVNSGDFTAVEVDSNYFDVEKFNKGVLETVKAKTVQLKEAKIEDVKTMNKEDKE